MKNEDFTISIIIPTYNRNEYTDKLLQKLCQQTTGKEEILVIDDGSNIPFKYNYLNVKVIRLNKNSGCASIPRNVGLDNAKGKYILFIDSDDMIMDNYLEEIRKSFKYEYDYCYFSWRDKHHEVIIENEPPEWNCCVWNCIYKRSLIGDTRFNPEIKIAEDYEFNKKVRKGTHRSIKKVLYYYNTDTESLMRKKG